MANKSLQSIKFPGLSDTYIVPQIDNTLTHSGQAADAKAVGDKITGLKEDLSYSVDKKNLFGHVNYYNFNGLLITENPDGTFKINGTATTTFDLAVIMASERKRITNGTYTLSGATDGSPSTYSIYFRYAESEEHGYSKNINCYTQPVSIVIDKAADSAYYYTGIHFVSGATFSNVVIRPMLEIGDYSKYTSVNETPNRYDTNMPLFPIKNQIPLDVIRTFNFSSNGITAIGNKDGIIIINGTATEDTYVTIISNANSINIDVSDVYTVTCIPEEESDTFFYARINNVSTRQYFGNVHRTFLTVPTSVSMSCAIFIKSGKTLNNFIVRPFVAVGYYIPPYSGHVLNEYEAQEWSNFIDIYEPTNLIGMPSGRKVNGLTLAVNNDGSVTINGTATASTSLAIVTKGQQKKLANGIYTISGAEDGSNNTYYVYFRYKLSDDSGETIKSISQHGSPHTFTVENAEDTAYFWSGIQVKSGVAMDNVVIYPMLEKGKFHNKFVKSSEEYKVQSSLTPIITKDSISLSNTARNVFASWTPLIPIEDSLGGQFLPAESYSGIPYRANAHFYGCDVFINRTIETFMSALLNPASIIYTDNLHPKPVYGGMCSSFTSWLYQQKMFRWTAELGGDADTFNGAYLTLYDYIDIHSVEIGDVIISRSGRTGHIECVEGLETDIATGKIAYVRLIDEKQPTLRRRVIEKEEFDKLMYPLGACRLGRYPTGEIRELGRLEYATDIITEYGNNTYFNAGESIWCFMPDGFSNIKIRKADSATEQVVTSLPSKIVTVDSKNYTLYNIGEYILDNAEYYVTTGKSKCPCKIIRINQGSVVFNDEQRIATVVANSDNATPAWAYIFGKTNNDREINVSHKFFDGNNIDIADVYNGEYVACKLYIFYETKYGQAVRETEWYSIN